MFIKEDEDMPYKISKKLEQVAEVDSELKMMRFIIDVPSEYFSYGDMKAVSLVYEDAKHHGTCKPFEKRVVIGVMQPEVLFNKYVYVGVKVEMKNDDVHYGYVYDKKLCADTLDFYKYKKIAQNVVDVLKQHIQ